MNQPRWEVWTEGYVVTGESSQATFHGVFSAPSFTEACSKAAKKHNWGDYFDVDKLTYWGCRCFSSEAAARKSFG